MNRSTLLNRFDESGQDHYKSMIRNDLSTDALTIDVPAAAAAGKVSSVNC